MLDRRLVYAINRGRCFILVGSGPSNEMGYPSWEKLAISVFSSFKSKGIDYDDESYKRYLKEKKYPELFRYAENILGNRKQLIKLVEESLNSTIKKQGVLYEIISRWPFACYLTTNYDDEIFNHLNSIGEYYSVVQNRIEDFYNYHDGVTHLIQKLHSDTNYPDNIVLTSEDYSNLYIDSSGAYYTDKLRMIFEMFDVLILGHSIQDEDIKHILKVAKKTACPTHPIYLTAANFTRAQEIEYFEKYNIVLIPYSNTDGSHGELKRMLLTVDRFIVPRNQLSARKDIQMIDPSEIASAASLFLFRKLQGVDSDLSFIPLILNGLNSLKSGSISKGDIFNLSSLKFINKSDNRYINAIEFALKKLINDKLACEEDSIIIITEGGKELVRETQILRETEKDQAFGQFSIHLKEGYNKLTSDQLNKCLKLAERAIVANFANRGLTIANQVFNGQTPSPDELSDVFGIISNIAVSLDNFELKAAFVDALHKLLIEPNLPQKKYLDSVSQGFFMYHLIGLDPECSKLRWEFFDKTLWFCDSSVVLPLLAQGCNNHEYALELFQTLKAAKATLYSTPKLLKEAYEHLTWAVNFIKNYSIGTIEFLRVALVQGSYKQNLFLDGFIRLVADGRIGNFDDYIDLAFPNGINFNSFTTKIKDFGVEVIDLADFSGFSQNDWADLEEIKEIIHTEREQRGTYRSTLQIDSEAEIWLILQNLRTNKYSFPNSTKRFDKFYFISQSKVLDKIFSNQDFTTWTPEAVYRYISTLRGKSTNPNLLQQCMLSEYYYAGISFIDTEKYKRFFGNNINTAKISFNSEKLKYESGIIIEFINNIEDSFDKTPDLEKPFFASQMGWILAEAAIQREEVAKQRVYEAELKTKKLESERDNAWKRRDMIRKEQVEATLRNAKNPKHIRKLKKQAKKRKKKK